MPSSTHYGSGILGSNNIVFTTGLNEEIIPDPPIGFTQFKTRYEFVDFSFVNSVDCHVNINNSPSNIFLRANQGFNVSNNGISIYYFKIVEQDVPYNWIGAYK